MVDFHNSRSRIGAAALLAGLLPFASAASAAVEISANPTANMTCSGGVCTPTARKAVLNVGDLANMLASGDVNVSSRSQAQDIEIVAALSWTSTSRLTLDSFHSIAFKKPVVVAGTGALTITTNDGGSGGDFQFAEKGHVEFWDLSSSLIINGSGYALVKSIRQIAKVAHTAGVRIAMAKNIDAGRTAYTSAPVIDLIGSLEGLGNTISNLSVNSNFDSGYLGLIGNYSQNSATDSIRDIRLAKAKIVGTAFGQTAGVLIGRGDGAILNVQVTGSVTANGTHSATGGLVGVNGGPLTRVSASVAVSVGTNGFAGGLIGTNIGTQFGSGMLTETYATGNVSGGDGAEAGGLIGDEIGATVSQSYALGTVGGGTNSFVGGLFGVNEDGNDNPRANQVYSTGAVSAGSGATVGGLIGQDAADSTISDAYWDLDTSGINNTSQGAGNIENDPGINGLTDAQSKSGLPSGFNPAVWGENSNVNNGYPYLTGNAPPK